MGLFGGVAQSLGDGCAVLPHAVVDAGDDDIQALQETVQEPPTDSKNDSKNHADPTAGGEHDMRGV